MESAFCLQNPLKFAESIYILRNPLTVAEPRTTSYICLLRNSKKKTNVPTKFTLQVFVREIHENFVIGIHIHFETCLKICLWSPGTYRHKIVRLYGAQFGLVMIFVGYCLFDVGLWSSFSRLLSARDQKTKKNIKKLGIIAVCDCVWSHVLCFALTLLLFLC